MTVRHRTTIGGPDDAFHTTQWTRVRAAGTDDPQKRKEVLNELIGRYWKPVYGFLRCRGYDNDRAKDLTQGFLLEVVLGRDLIRTADREKGRFRTLLLTALKRYVTDVHRYETARKRGPQETLASLDAFDPDSIGSVLDSNDPAAAFNFAWASDLLRQALDALHDELMNNNQTTHWHVFEACVVQPILEGASAPALAELCQEFDIDTTSKASNMIVTAKRRFRGVLRRIVRDMVEDEAMVDQEIDELIEILSHRGAG